MTGFARTTTRVSDALGFTLSLKSVNHRFLDLHLRLPSGTDELEMRMRRTLKEKVRRGHLEVTLSLDRTSKVKVQYNRTLVGAYLSAFHAASQEFGIIQEPNLNTIFRLPGVLAEDASSSDEDDAALADAVIAQLDTLVAALNTMRAQEGQSLAADLRAGLDRLESLVNEVASLREDIQRAYFDRVSQRLTGLLNGHSIRNACCRRPRCSPNAATCRKRSRAFTPTSNTFARCSTRAERSARRPTSCCRSSIAKPTRCCRRPAGLRAMVRGSPN